MRGRGGRDETSDTETRRERLAHAAHASPCSQCALHHSAAGAAAWSSARPPSPEHNPAQACPALAGCCTGLVFTSKLESTTRCCARDGHDEMCAVSAARKQNPSSSMRHHSLRSDVLVAPACYSMLSGRMSLAGSALCHCAARPVFRSSRSSNSHPAFKHWCTTQSHASVATKTAITGLICRNH